MKKALLMGMALLLALALCACGQTKQVELDMTALTDELRTLCGTDLYELDEDTASTLYGVTAEELVVWASGGVTADEVAVFRAADETAAEELLTAAQTRLSAQENAMADYNAEEADKLKDAIAEQHGTYVVVCVSGDSAKAREIIDGYIK